MIVIGSNLPNNQPVSTKYLRAAKRAGTRIVVVNPFREPALERYWIPSVASSALFGTALMDDYFGVRPGGDIAFLSGVLKALDEIGGWDERFVAERTTGADSLREHLKRLALGGDRAATRASSEAEIRRFAELYAGAKTAVIVYSMGLTQYEFGVENVKMVVNFALARGMIGREKCGIMPIRGHSGVQGTAECGADADKLPGGVPIDDENCARFEAAYAHPIPRRERPARGAPARARGGARPRLALPGRRQPPRNHAGPRTLRAARSRTSELRVHQDIVLNSSTLLDARASRARAARADALRAEERRHLDLDRTPHPLHSRDPGAAHRRGPRRVGNPGADRPALAPRARGPVRLREHAPDPRRDGAS